MRKYKNFILLILILILFSFLYACEFEYNKGSEIKPPCEISTDKLDDGGGIYSLYIKKTVCPGISIYWIDGSKRAFRLTEEEYLKLYEFRR